MTRRLLCETVALLLVGEAALGCARTATVPAPGPVPAPGSSSAPNLADMLRGDLAADAAFAWSATRRLAWSDFQGRPPAAGSEGARTAYTLYYAWSCRGQAFQFRVIVGFRPRQSWVKPVVVNDAVQSRSVLGHEQTHFDLAEVHARRIRRAFAGLVGPCRKPDAELTALAQRLVQEEKAEQRRYDDETKHGLLVERQATWSRGVARRLAESRP